MMDKTAMEYIASMAMAGTGMLQPKTDCPASALPENFRIENLEKLQSQRYRFRGTMETHNLKAFGAYCKEHAATGAVCMVDQDSMAATAIFNFGDSARPGHCDNKAVLRMKPTAEYEALQQVEGKQLEQRNLAEFLEDWRHLMTFKAQEGEDGQARTLTIFQALAAIREMKTRRKTEAGSEEGSFRTARTASEEMDLANAENFPAFITYRCSPYDHLQEREFVLRVSTTHTEHDKPRLTLRLVRKTETVQDTATEFANRLTDDALLETNMEVFQGSFAP